jgi:hypothetical protein
MARKVTVSPWSMKNDRQLIQLAKSRTLDELTDELRWSPVPVLKRAARLGLSIKRKAERKMTMRTLLILTAIIGLSASAFAQTVEPKVGGKPAKQVKLPRTFQCFDCDRPDPLKSDALGWLSGELGRSE